jgi:signal transduction histidine kinase
MTRPSHLLPPSEVAAASTAPRSQARRPRRAPRAPRGGTGWPAARIISAGIAAMTVFSVLAIVIGAIALTDLSAARSRVVDRLDPASYQASQLYAALLNQETGVRGYAISAQRSFLQPYTLGLAGEKHSLSRLTQVLAGLPGAQRDVAQVLGKVSDWRTGYAIPTIDRVQATGKPFLSPDIAQGKADFDSLRVTLTALQNSIADQRHQALAGLSHAATTLDVACIGIAVGLLLVVILLTLGVRNAAIRPLSRLAADARQIADGDFDHDLSQSGPREVRDLGADVSRMRERILSELAAVQGANSALEARTQDLQRSNSELEQFAYVASHDLQEPLRKVASFCQLLQRRYGGKLDERADQYIEYAVDGAKRMQLLINDLLAFSRVGRVPQQRRPTPAADLLTQAEANLATVIRKTRARIEADELPMVLAEPTLLTAVFQNLLSNAIKFRGPETPHISVSARQVGEQAGDQVGEQAGEQAGDFWEFAFADNGIGIEAHYAERIFVIFQRLHDKATYPGTGIGLAMSRKIVEYHGGRIWLDTTVTSGSCFRFTLPVIPPEPGAAGESALAEALALAEDPAAAEEPPLAAEPKPRDAPQDAGG